MPFCTNCGAAVAGAFCQQCGTPAAPAASSAPAAPPADVGRKKTSPVIWIIGIVLALMVLGVLAMVGAGLFVASKVKQAGLDPELLQRNPAVAITKMLAAVNPDVEMVSLDEGKGVVTLRDKKTGKTVTLNFEDVRQGKITFQAEGQEQVTVEARGDGQSGALQVRSPEGTMTLGADANAKIPDWIPSYPSSKPVGTFSMQGGEGEGGTYQFATRDALKDVMNFYDLELQKAGLTVTTRATHAAGGMLSAEDEGKKRSVVVTLSPAEGGTRVNVMFQVKK
jgi:hypothetical protein